MGEVLGETNKCDLKSAIVFVFGLIFGTFSILTSKLLYEMFAVGSDGTYKQYQKPVTTVLVMFGAMFFALPIYWIQQTFFTSPSARDKVEGKVLVKMIVPATFDMLGTALSQAGLLYTTASMFQLLRCSVIIVTAVLKVAVLKEKLYGYMWIGVGVNAVAMTMVGATGFLGTGAGVGSNPKLGIALILSSCFVQGAQYVFEEKIMSHDNCPPLVVIGMEGFWGMLTTIFIAMPIAYYIPGHDCGSYENIYDSWVMWNNDVNIKIMVFCFFVSITGYNTMSIYVTQFLSAVWHAILDNFRPISIWGLDLFIFYFLTPQTYGESWTHYSWFQFFGMMLLFLGTAIYNGSVPFLIGNDAYYEELGGEKSTPAMRTPRTGQTPNLSRSPLLVKNIMAKTQERARLLKAQAKDGADIELAKAGGHARQNSLDRM